MCNYTIIVVEYCLTDWRTIMRIKLGPYTVEIRAGRYLGYTPEYNSACFRDKMEPPGYCNTDGKLLEPFFLSDTYRAHDPYIKSRYLFFDRYNWGLDKHIYTCRNMLYPVGIPSVKYGAFTESRTIVPDDYEKVCSSRGIADEYRYIFTYDDAVLNDLPNAVMAPFSAYYWYGSSDPGNISDDLYRSKSKNVSVLASKKELCHMHSVRKAFAEKCKESGLADTFGTFDGGTYLDSVDETLKDYRFSIVVENDISDYYFTEKITNCFISQTVPIYIGARKIDEFFNCDGIIQITEKDLDHMETILSECDEDSYMGRIDAILDNYRRVQQYENIWDYIYLKYLKE